MENIDIVSLINYFHKAPVVNTKSECGFEKVDFAKVNEIAVRLGYLIHPDCCTKHVLSWLNTLTFDYNATFYKEWNDIVSKNRFELFVDQIIHYLTTYGTEFSNGNGYVPNDGSEAPDFKNLKVIEPITMAELFDRCYDVVKSGIALNEKTMNVICDFIIHSVRSSMCKIDLDLVKNKEAQVYLSVKLNIFPSDEFAILRCLMYQYTGSCVLIKNKSTIIKIKSGAANFDNLIDFNHPINSLNENQIEGLSRIFYRFKPLFLAMKTKKSSRVINRIRKLAKKNHTPLKSGFWETIVSSPKSYAEIESRIGEIDNFKKVRILQAIDVALKSNENAKVYNIRNGKVYTRCSYNPSYDNTYLNMIRPLFENSLVESLSKNACKVKFDEHCNITLPSSEKSFIGNYPFGSSVKFEKNAVVGIYWRNEWGTHDFDLSFMNLSGSRVGWNANYLNGDVIYSGDMTNASPEAVELMYIKNGCTDSMVCVNQFYGEKNSKFRLFFANEALDPKNMRNHMVDPNNIKIDTMIDVCDEKQKTVGIIKDNTFYFMNLHSGNRIVSGFDEVKKSYINTMCERTKCFVQLKDILLKAGFTEVEDGETPDIDFSDLEKDTLINLLSNG